jgi:hypothetical protein
LTGSAGERSDDHSNNNSNKRKAMDTLVQTLTSATSHIAQVLETKQIDSSRGVDKDDGRVWDEYLKLAEKFLDMKDDPNKLPLLRNLAIRITKLERQCGIPPEQSITYGVVEIPAEVFTMSLASTSDITNNKS